MNNAVRTGLSVIDASSAMEGNGPSDGALVDIGLIVAGTSPLATDMVGAKLMGFEPDEIPFIHLAHKSGHDNYYEFSAPGFSNLLTRSFSRLSGSL